MIGLKSAAAIALALGLCAIAVARGCSHGLPRRAIGLGVVSGRAHADDARARAGRGRLAVRRRSRGAIGLAGGKPVVVDDAAEARELPGGVQRLLRVSPGSPRIVLGAFGNRAAARIIGLPDNLGEPSPSAYCLPKSDRRARHPSSSAAASAAHAGRVRARQARLPARLHQVARLVRPAHRGGGRARQSAPARARLHAPPPRRALPPLRVSPAGRCIPAGSARRAPASGSPRASTRPASTSTT